MLPRPAALACSFYHSLHSHLTLSHPPATLPLLLPLPLPLLPSPSSLPLLLPRLPVFFALAQSSSGSESSDVEAIVSEDQQSVQVFDSTGGGSDAVVSAVVMSDVGYDVGDNRGDLLYG